MSVPTGTTTHWNHNKCVRCGRLQAGEHCRGFVHLKFCALVFQLHLICHFLINRSTPSQTNRVFLACCRDGCDGARFCTISHTSITLVQEINSLCSVFVKFKRYSHAVFVKFKRQGHALTTPLYS